MKVWLKHSIFTISIAVFCVGVALILHSDKKEMSICDCREVKVEIIGEHEFVTVADVNNYISKEYGQVVGQRTSSIRLHEIESILDSKSAVQKSEVWITTDGVMHVVIRQREPAARFQKGDTGFYVDDRGYIFPLHKTYTAPVPIVSGSIPVYVGSNYKGPAATAPERKWLGEILDLLDYIGSSRHWKSCFSSITVRSNGDLVLKAAEGEESFIFGAPDDFAKKFYRIDKYYTEIAPLKAEGYYKTVNVKFNGQIVCRQK